MSFKQFDLNPEIIKAVENCGYTTPTPIQEKSIPYILDGTDLVAVAQTGTGKTAAFVLPLLHKLQANPPSKKTSVLILTPTRELATQIAKAIQTYGKFMRVNTANLVGGMSYHTQIKDLQRGADIIIATPGRLMDHIQQHRVNLAGIETLVLDEADRMLDMGFIDDVRYIAKLTPGQRQTLLFSATMDKALSEIIKQLLKSPVRIDLTHEKITAPKIEQHFYKTNSIQQKTRLLKHLLTEENVFKAIIFSATKRHADKLADDLSDDGFSAMPLHGDLRQATRNRTLDQLRSGKIQFLVATDVAARGIDVNDVTHVFNFDLPKHSEDYVHRIGRTGRAGKSGKAISFVSPQDALSFKHIERLIGHRIKVNNAPDMAAGTHHDDDKPKKKLGTKKPREEFASRKDSSPREKFADKKRSNKETPFAHSSDDQDDEIASMFKALTSDDDGDSFNREEKPRREASDRTRSSRDDKPARKDGGRFKGYPDKDKPRREGSGDRFRSRDDKPRREGSSDRFRSRDDKPRREGGGDRFRSRDDKPHREGSSDRFRGRDDKAHREGSSDRFRGRDDKPRREGSSDRFRGRDDKPRREGSSDRFRGRDDKPRREGSSDRFRGRDDKPRREGSSDRFRGRDDKPRREGSSDRFRSRDDKPRREGSSDRFRSRDDKPRRAGSSDRPRSRDDRPTSRDSKPSRGRKTPSNAWRADDRQSDDRPRKFSGAPAKKKSFKKKRRD